MLLGHGVIVTCKTREWDKSVLVCGDSMMEAASIAKAYHCDSRTDQLDGNISSSSTWNINLDTTRRLAHVESSQRIEAFKNLKSE